MEHETFKYSTRVVIIEGGKIRMAYQGNLLSKTLVIGIILLFIGMSIIPSSSTPSEKRYSIVLDSPGYIQDLINKASDGDTINIPSGTYYENIVIDKSINLIGENRNTTVIDGSGSGDVVYVSADWVNISRFTIQNGDLDGIDVSSDHITISENNIYNNKISGIYSYGYKSIKIINNIFNNNTGGISLVRNNFSFIKDNFITNTGIGIDLYSSSHNNITKNKISDNDGGITLSRFSYYNIIEDNIISNNVGGIGLYYTSDNNSIIKNQIISNIFCGIIGRIYNNTINGNNISNNKNKSLLLISSNNNKINNNVLNNNYNGIEFYNCCNNTIINNNISFNNNKGIFLNNSSSKNIIYHNNIINNSQNGYDQGNNTWDNSYPSGGNYWDDYIGEDNDGDGIGDTPYPIHGGDNEDRYPLMEPWSNKPPEAPVIDGPMTVKIGEDNEFTFSAVDTDGDDVSFIIDWGDGNETGWLEFVKSGTEVKLKHNWSMRGVYTMQCKAKDVFGIESKITEFYVEVIKKSRQTTPFLWFQLFFDRFPLLEVFLRAMNLLR